MSNVFIAYCEECKKKTLCRFLDCDDCEEKGVKCNVRICTICGSDIIDD